MQRTQFLGDTMKILKLNNIDKIYGDNIKAVSNVTLDIESGEFIALLGPSGCGKTTTLRMIAGLEEISSGELELHGEVANDLRPDKRNVAMVFQDYALIPHMNVFDNIGYPLKIAKKSKEEIKSTVEQIASMVKLDEYMGKKPGELSGGQRQRVALARALVKDTDLVLMDEPLSNLDVELRASARRDILKINKEFKKTIIYVTHDQIEAMTMADRIVVMKKGVVQQIGTGKEIYHNPSNEFVAQFIGNPGMNIFEIGERENLIEKFNIPSQHHIHGATKIGIRPEYCMLSNETDNANFVGKLVAYEDYGNDIILELKGIGGCLKVRVPNLIDLKIGEQYGFKFVYDKLVYFNQEGNRISYE